MDLNTLLKQMQGTQMGQALTGYLQGRGKMPEMVMERPRSPGAAGTFQYGDDMPPNGKVTVAPWATLETLVHELTHAADRQMVNQFYGSYVGREESNPQFQDAYKKLHGWNGRGKLAEKMHPGWYKAAQGDAEYGQYRSSNSELGGWATGNMYNKYGGSDNPPHLDATLATEMLILLDLASRKKK